MKTLTYILALFFVCSLTNAQSETQSDTINQIDENNLKQGWWIFYYKEDQSKKKSEGRYKNSRKQGLWRNYFLSQKLKSEITYANNRPSGFYKVYYENGNVEEEGVWKNNRNIQTFKRYHENGQVSQDFNFNETGKREGKQVYYYENGQVMIEGEWSGGKEAGVIKEYNEDGSLKAEKYFNNGAMDAEKSKIYEKKDNALEKDIADAPEKVVKADPTKVETGSKTIKFTGNGPYKLYNKNKQIEKDGVFKNYRLMDGKWYRYNDDGILIKIEIYKNGRYIGDGVIEE